MLTPIEKKQLDRYEQMVAMPKWKYILIYGIIGWGLTVGVIVSAITYFSNRPHKDLASEILINLIGFPIGGIFFGMFMRGWLMPRQIKRLKEKMNQP